MTPKHNISSKPITICGKSKTNNSRMKNQNRMHSRYKRMLLERAEGVRVFK